MSVYTPLMKQYLAVKADYPSMLLLFRMGDFYELFFDDAERAADLLSITLTHRASSSSKPIPMAGVPYHAIDQYLARLVKMGESAAICEQIGEQPDGKGLMERRVTRVITPGTVTEPDILSERDACLLMALAPTDNDTVGYAWLDVSRGSCRAGVCAASAVADVLARLSPAEILLPEDGEPPATGRAALKFLPAWRFTLDGARRILQKQFDVRELDGFGLRDKPAAIIAAGALLHYAQEAHQQTLSHLDGIAGEEDDKFIGMTASTRASLELTRTLSGEKKPTLLSVLDCCQTAMGGRYLSELLHQPPRAPDHHHRYHEAVAALLDGVPLAPLQQALQAFADLQRLAGRIALSTALPRELVAVRTSYRALPVLVTLLKEMDNPLLAELTESCQSDGAVEILLSDALREEPAATLREGGVIADNYSSELDEFRVLQNGAESHLEDIGARARTESGVPSLRVQFNKVHGFFIEMPRSMASKAPPGWQRRQTLKNAERYITPELKALEEKVLAANERANALERRLYGDLLVALQPHVATMKKIAAAIMQIDVLVCFAVQAQTHDWQRPTFSDVAELHIEGGRHPIVQEQVGHFVANDVALTADNRLGIVTGPNMGGKSTYLRQLALIVILAYMGSYVPAHAARIGVVDKIFTRIGAADDLAGGRSTFMVEMTEVAEILHNAGAHSIVLLDEIGRGTATYDGLALAWATSEALLEQNQSLTLFATHYFELTELAAKHAGAFNRHVSAHEHGDEIIFLHRVEDGAASRSYGVQVAKLAGVPAAAVQRATQLLHGLEQRDNKQSGSLPLFAESPPSPPPAAAAHSVLRRRLASIKPDELSPREALAVLYELKNTAADGEKE